MTTVGALNTDASNRKGRAKGTGLAPTVASTRALLDNPDLLGVTEIGPRNVLTVLNALQGYGVVYGKIDSYSQGALYYKKELFDLDGAVDKCAVIDPELQTLSVTLVSKSNGERTNVRVVHAPRKTTHTYNLRSTHKLKYHQDLAEACTTDFRRDNDKIDTMICVGDFNTQATALVKTYEDKGCKLAFATDDVHTSDKGCLDNAFRPSGSPKFTSTKIHADITDWTHKPISVSK